MKGNPNLVQRFAPVLLIILGASYLMWSPPAADAAERWGLVTIQYSQSTSYSNTFPIYPGTVKYVQDSVGAGNVGFADDPNNSSRAWEI
jgi:hypothetical protein